MTSRSTGLIALLLASTAMVWFLARPGPGSGTEESSRPGERAPGVSASSDVSIVERPDGATPASNATRRDTEDGPQPAPGARTHEAERRATEPQPPETTALDRVVVRVLFPDGKPAPGTRVLLTNMDPDADAWFHLWYRTEGEALFTDGKGRCTVRDVPADVDLVVISEGYLPAEIRDFDDWCTSHAGEEAVLRLEGEALAIRGQVLDADDNPASGWSVCVHSTPISPNHSLEDFIRYPVVVQRRSAAETDDDGRFEIFDLVDSEYTLVAIAGDGSDYAFAADVPAGTDGVTLRSRPDRFRDEVRGTVSGWNGTPVAGASVEAVLSTSWNGGWGASSCETDELGRFVLDRVPRFLTTISVRADRAVGREIELDPANWNDDVTIVVERWAPVRVELAETIEIPLDMWGVDAEGTRIDLNRIDENGAWTGGGVLEVRARQTEVRWLRESAMRLAFYRPNGWHLSPVHEVDVALNPDVACNVVRVGF